MKSLHAVIMAGGKGTRFWPLSREMFPKQYLKLVGQGSLLQDTIQRLGGLVEHDNVHIITTAAQRSIVDWQTGEVGAAVHVVVEPVGKNTAPAIAYMAFRIYGIDPDALLLILPADHHISDGAKFHAAVKTAAAEAAKGRIVTFGVVPARPETGYGYIKAGAEVVKGVYEVERFVEKPDRLTAERYLEEGGYYWNSGMFVFSARAMLEELKTHMPATHAVFEEASRHFGAEAEAEAAARAYEKAEEQSIDYGVMEKSGHVLVVRADFPWSDIGSWNALDEVLPSDASGNVVMGNVVGIDCHESIIVAGDKLVSAIGLRGMVVVDTHDATLIVPKDRVQEVKDMVARLKSLGKEEYLNPRVEERPWGQFTVLEQGPSYKIKNITLRPGGRLSLQSHRHRSEHWVVVSGTARVTRGDDVIEVSTNESTFIPAGVRHRLENPGEAPLTIIEVQSGEYLGEDDIIRFDDQYGRDKG